MTTPNFTKTATLCTLPADCPAICEEYNPGFIWEENKKSVISSCKEDKNIKCPFRKSAIVKIEFEENNA